MTDTGMLVKRLEKLLPPALADQVAAEVLDSLWFAEHDQALREDVLAEQDEPEWEYARRGVQPGVILAPDSSYEESVKRVEAAGGRRYQQVVRRRKAGPWVPVEENGENA